MQRVLVIHGPNLNLLGKREKNIYGATSLDKINIKLENIAKDNGISLSFFQSNIEGEIINFIHKHGFDSSLLIINPGAYTHTSVAIRDAILAVNIPVIEVHMSNVYKREEFRHKSFIRDIAVGQITGFGEQSYYLAMNAAITHINQGQ